MVTFIFTFDLRSSHVQVKKGQILKLDFLNISFLFIFPSKIQKCHLFCRTTTRNLKNRAFKNDFIAINRFLGHFTGKNEDIGFKICITVVNHSSITYILFFRYLKNFGFFDNYLWKKNRNFDKWGQKPRISKIRDSYFVEHFILHLLVFVGCVSL